jgi:hypothetical protein
MTYPIIIQTSVWYVPPMYVPVATYLVHLWLDAILKELYLQEHLGLDIYIFK